MALFLLKLTSFQINMSSFERIS